VTAAVLLCAGGSTRFAGKQHKLLTPFRGRPLVAWALEHVAEAQLDETIVVVGSVDLTEVLLAEVVVVDNFASGIVGTDWETYRREGPGMSAFTLEDGVVYHTYSAYARGLDGLWGMYQWLDRAPLGRNEAGMWWRRHDEYDNQ